MRKIRLVQVLLLFSFIANAQTIKVNQLGFYVDSKKVAVVPSSTETRFSIVRTGDNVVVYRGLMSTPKRWSYSGETVSIADFSQFNQKGTYYVSVGQLTSNIFEISEKDIFKNLVISSLKAFYFWRSSTKIDSAYAQFGDVNFARKAGHLDTNVSVHVSAQNAFRPAGTKLSAPKGWYDAGDYNLYTINAGPAVFSLLQLYEQKKSFFKVLNTNIPESKNSIPDLLDEVKYEIDWLLSMFDSTDDGVYFKLTSKSFCGMVMPHEDTYARFMVGKSTTSALVFSAMMAKFYRSFKEYDGHYADSCLQLSKRAYNWALKNPNVAFKNPTDITTGGYGDSFFEDEFTWANIELYLSTGDTTYLSKVNFERTDLFIVPGWRNVATYGLLSIANHIDTLQINASTRNTIDSMLETLANAVATVSDTSAYSVPLNEFRWGSNGHISIQGMIALTSYKVTGSEKYFNAALSALDYLLGRNATGFCFVSGFGSKSPMYLHDRRCSADRIADPIPGYLSGGPTTDAQRDCGSYNYPSTFPAKSFLDKECSFSTNEIAINWSGPFAYLVGFIEAELTRKTISPVGSTTDSTGSYIDIEFPEDIEMEGVIVSDFNVHSQTKLIHIDSALLFVSSAKMIRFKISEPILSTDTLVTISYEGSGLRTKNGVLVDSSFSQNVRNNTIGAAPYIVSAKTSNDGRSISLIFNKKLKDTTLDVSGFEVMASGVIVSRDAVLDLSTRNTVTIAVDRVFRDNTVLFSYYGSSLISVDSARFRKTMKFPVENLAPVRPPIPVEGSTTEDGMSVFLFFDKIVKDNYKPMELTVSIHNSGKVRTVPIKRHYVDGYKMNLLIDSRFLKGDSIVLNYKSSNLTSFYGDTVHSFSNFGIKVSLMKPQTVYSLSKQSSSTIELEDYAYNYGMALEENPEASGGYQLAYTDVGDWVDYLLDVKDSGYYLLDVRVSSALNTGMITFSNFEKNELLAKIKTPLTTSWNVYKVASGRVKLQQGIQTIRLNVDTAGFNADCMKFTYDEQQNATIQDIAFDVFPNPSKNGHFNVTYSPVDTRIEFRIVDSTGKIFSDVSINGMLGKYEFQLQKEGIYLIEMIIDGTCSSIQKIIFK